MLYNFPVSAIILQNEKMFEKLLRIMMDIAFSIILFILLIFF